MEQSEFHPKDERREVDGDTGQPIADEAAAGLPEAVVFADPGDENVPAPIAGDDPVRLFGPPPSVPMPGSIDDSRVMLRRMEVWRDEFFAWVRPLASAAGYATLIVALGFQVARVEGQG